MVSVFEGQLARTWQYKFTERTHTITLYHDTISGVRSAMLNYEEIPGSNGVSTLLMESKGHRLFFDIESQAGYIEIKRCGWTSFSYACIVNDVAVNESTQVVAANQDPVFRVKVAEVIFIPDEESDKQLAWYIVESTRISDNVSTRVHR